MTRVFSTSLGAFGAGLLTLIMANSALAQYYGGSTNAPPSGDQALARGLAGSGDPQGPINFSYAGGGGGWGYGGWGGGGGGFNTVATPWSSKYGGWIVQPTSYWGQDDISRQQATIQGKFQYQDLELRRLQMKRAAFDEMRYEKMNTPPPEVEREEQRLDRLARARNTPPLDEISSGQALNELLTDIQRIRARDGIAGPSIPVDQDTVKHINVTTTGDNSGSNQFFKPGNFPEWPNAFLSDDFAEYKKRIIADLNDLAQAQLKGKLDPAKAVNARRLTEGLKTKLFEIRTQVSFNDYVAALEFLSKLNDTIALLSKPGAKNYLDGTYAAQGKSIGELVTHMISKGLKFAPATVGFEPYYSGLYQLLVTYDLALARMTGMDQAAMRGSFFPPPKQ